MGSIRDRAARALYALGGLIGGYSEIVSDDYTYDADEADMTFEEIAGLHADKLWRYAPIGGAPDAEQVEDICNAAVEYLVDNPDEGSYGVGRFIALRHKDMPNTVMLTLWVASVDTAEQDGDEYEESE